MNSKQKALLAVMLLLSANILFQMYVAITSIVDLVKPDTDANTKQRDGQDILYCAPTVIAETISIIFAAKLFCRVHTNTETAPLLDKHGIFKNTTATQDPADDFVDINIAPIDKK
jgi:hypothetical protein